MMTYPAPHLLVTGPPAKVAAKLAPASPTVSSAPRVSITAEERNRHENLALAKLTAAGIVIILVLFLTMMIILSTHGPTNIL